MRYLMLSAATILLAFGLSACKEETKTVVQPVPVPVPSKEVVKEKETVVVQPVPVPGPAGPPGQPGPEGAKGAPGKPGGDTIVIVPPPEPRKY